MNEEESLKMIMKTDCRSLQESIKSEAGIKNRMLRIELANVKHKLEEGIIDKVKWISNKEQLADMLTKKDGRKINERIICEIGGRGGEKEERELK